MQEMHEIWVPSLGWEDPLEKEMTTYSSILAWRIPWTEEPGGLQSMGPRIRVFSNESALHMRWPKYWSFSFSISPSNEHPGLISFRMDWGVYTYIHTIIDALKTPITGEIRKNF